MAIGAFPDLSGIPRTLAAIYAFGLGDDPTADNVFEMPSGNRRWADGRAITDAFATVSDAFWETPNVTTDGRVGAWITRRWASDSRPSLTFRSDILYNAAYTGTPIDTMEWVSEQAWLTGVLNETGTSGGDQYGARRYFLSSFFFGQPVAQPDPGSAGGSYLEEFLDLYNGGSVSGVHPSHKRTGWGQNFAYVKGQHAGITPGHIAWYDPSTIPDAIGNGTGFWIGQGLSSQSTSDRTVGGFEAHMLAANTAGAWGLGLWAFDGVTPGVLQKVATFDNTGGTVLGQPIPAAYTAAGVDFMTPGFYVFSMPTLAGKKFQLLSGRWFVDTRDAALTTAPIAQISQNGTPICNNTMTTSLAFFNALPAPFAFSTLPSIVETVATDLHDIQFQVTVGAAGVGLTTCSGRFVMTGYYQ